MTGHQVSLFSIGDDQVDVGFPQVQDPFLGDKALVMLHQLPPLYRDGLVGGQLPSLVDL